MKTAYEIAALTSHLSGLENRQAINYLFQQQEDPDLWPIPNVTKLAIQRYEAYQQKAEEPLEGLEYALFLEGSQIQIANDPRLW